jgi:hypothetical protein
MPLGESSDVNVYFRKSLPSKLGVGAQTRLGKGEHTKLGEGVT